MKLASWRHPRKILQLSYHIENEFLLLRNEYKIGLFDVEQKYIVCHFGPSAWTCVGRWYDNCSGGDCDDKWWQC